MKDRTETQSELFLQLEVSKSYKEGNIPRAQKQLLLRAHIYYYGSLFMQREL